MDAPRIVVIGDCNPDLVLRGGARPRFGQAEVLVDGALLTIGGSGAITAVGAARLGADAALVAAVGADALGRIQLEALAATGVDADSVVVRGDEVTGISVVLSDGDDRAILTATGAIGSLRASDVDPALLAAADHVHVSALFLLGDLRAELGKLLRAARAGGATVSLDTNWDPDGDWGDAVEPLLAEVDVLLPNLQEAEALSGRTGAEAACAALAARVGTVAVKLGPEGAIAMRGAEVARVGAPAIDVVDTTGAGDSFNAGLLTALLDGEPLAAALALAVACGSLSTAASGGTGAQPDLERARALAATLP